MDRLWTPWRYAYISGDENTPAKGVPDALSAWIGSDPEIEGRHCVFCNLIASVDYAIAHGMPKEAAEREALIVQRGPRTFICLNRYPYSNGHVLIAPYQHCESLARLPGETAQELMNGAQQVESILRDVYHPHGLNFGLNLGAAAGAGVAEHLHMHALPRWAGDTNFMTVVAETRILPETLESTWKKLHAAFAAAG